METTSEEQNEHGVIFWVAVIVGAIVAGVGVRGVFHQFPLGQQRYVFFRYLVVSDLTHDIIVAPVLFIVGWIASRISPPWLRAPLAFGGFASAISLAIAWYPLQGTASYKQNPTFQPLNYTTAILTVFAVAWGIAAVWAALRFRGRNTLPAKAAR